MGLDIVELVLEIEDTFDIRIPDDRAGEFRTVGQLYDYILQLKQDSPLPNNICLSAATFYLLRRNVCQKLGLDRRSMRPHTSLDATIPPSRRPRFWTELQSAIDLKLPRLASPQWVAALELAIAAVPVTWLALLTARTWGIVAGFLTFAVALPVLAVLLDRISTPLHTKFKPTFSTYGGLAHVVLAHNYSRLSDRYSSWSPDDIWQAMRQVIADELGVKPEDVTKDASFVDDFHMG